MAIELNWSKKQIKNSLPHHASVGGVFSAIYFALSRKLCIFAFEESKNVRQPLERI